MLERILSLMEQLGITKNKLAKLANLPRTTIYHALECEKNCRNTKLETMQSISAALCTTLDYIVVGTVNTDTPDTTKTIVSVGRGGKRTEYEINDEDAVLVDAFLKRLKKD